MGDSTPAMRMLSVLFGTLTVPFLGWFIGRLAGPGPACLAALFLAVAPFHIDYSQEARPYTLFPFLILAATAALSWALDRRSARRWALYAFLALLACYTHYFTAFYLAGHGAFIGLVCWKERKLWPATDWALSMVAVAVGFLPWLPFMLRSNLQSVQWLEDYLRQWTPFMQLSVTVMSLLFGCTYPLPLGIYCYLAVIILTPPAVWLAYRRSQRSGVGSRPAQSNSALAPDTCQPGDAFAITLLAVMTVVPLAIAWLFSQFRPSLMHRYVIPTVPAALALIALAIWRLRWLPLRVVLASSLAVYWLLCLQGQLADPTKPELRLTAAHIANHMKPGDGILIQPWAQNLVLSYFLRERMLPIVNEYDWRRIPTSQLCLPGWHRSNESGMCRSIRNRALSKHTSIPAILKRRRHRFSFGSRSSSCMPHISKQTGSCLHADEGKKLIINRRFQEFCRDILGVVPQSVLVSLFGPFDAQAQDAGQFGDRLLVIVNAQVDVAIAEAVGPGAGANDEDGGRLLAALVAAGLLRRFQGVHHAARRVCPCSSRRPWPCR